VLCAGFPGNGTTVQLARRELNAFESGDQQKVMAALFPADQTAAQYTYIAAISSYPAAPAAPAGTVTAQGHAVDQWWAGTDPAGTRPATITVPTLVADGTLDRLDPVANSQTLAALIHGAELRLYPDAGHAFLFQNQANASPSASSPACSPSATRSPSPQPLLDPNIISHQAGLKRSARWAARSDSVSILTKK